MEKHFEEYRSNDLEPKDFMPLRGKHYDENIFFNHSIYKQIADSIQNNSLTLVLGNPISGKSRITYDTLKKLSDFRILKANKKTICNLPNFIFDSNMSDCVMVFDDVDEFFGKKKNNEQVNNLLIEVINRNIKCVLTCRIGPEFKRFKKYVDKHIVNEFSESKNSFLIPRFSRNYKPLDIFLKKHKVDFRNDIKEFDGNLGSLIVPLSDMRKRFDKLLINDEKLPLAILLGLKLHYHLLNFEQTKRNYDILNIMFFCKKYLGLNKIDTYDWDKALKTLIDSRTDLNFIEVTDTINIEEVYLDIFENKEDVIFDGYSKKRFFKLLNSHYTTIDKEVCNFPLNTIDFNKKIKLSSTYEEGLEIFQTIENPDAFSFTNLMGLTDDLQKIIELYELMRKNNRVSEFFIPHNTVINKFKSFKDLYSVLKRVNSKQLQGRNGTTNRLISLAQKNPKESLEILFENEQILDIYKNTAFNDIVLRCVQDEEDYANYLKPILPKLDVLDITLQKNIIKSCIKTKQYKNSIILLNKYIDGYDLYNELGNCYLHSNFEKSIEYYEKSLDEAKYLSEFLKSHNNLNRVFYYNNIQEKYPDLILNSHTFLKTNYKDLASDEKCRNLKYLVKYIILNEISGLDNKEEIIKKIKFLSTRYYVSKVALKLAISEMPFELIEKIKDIDGITIDNNV